MPWEGDMRGRIQSRSGPRVAIIGGGIAGVEAALTIALGHPDARVTLLARSPMLRVAPNLVYIPFGVDADLIDVRLDVRLPQFGIKLLIADVAAVDVSTSTTQLRGGRELTWDALVLAPGSVPSSAAGLRLRTLADAQTLRTRLEELLDAHWPTSMAIRILPDSTWPAPAYELAFLTDAWLRSHDRRDDVDLFVITEDSAPFQFLGADPPPHLAREMQLRGISMVSGVPGPRIEGIDADLTIDVGGLAAARVRGMHTGPDGFYVTDTECRMDNGVYVVGDAGSSKVKAAFVAAWQARRVLADLGGDVERLGTATDGVPHDQVVYEMDLGGETMAVRLAADDLIIGPQLRPAAVSLHPTLPDKLRGLLMRALLLGDHPGSTPAARLDTSLQVRRHLRLDPPPGHGW
jgi:sulfide:quinone oxidoreductase